MIINKKLATAITTGAILLQAFTPLAFADTKITNTGNGSASSNNLSLTQSHSVTVDQNNRAYISNDVQSDNTTGRNTADDNTGGTVAIDTGNASSLTTIANEANKNIAVGGCGACGNDSTSVDNSGNGSFSNSALTVDTSNNASVFQNNDAKFDNSVRSDNNTGDNSADRNTGDGVRILTGHAFSATDVSNAANANIAKLGGDNGKTGGSSLDVKNVGNGSASDNQIDVTQSRTALVEQNNNADFQNYLTSKNRTGYNSADDNTGGRTTIDTGNASSDTMVSNQANLNKAIVSCGCDGDVMIKNAGNGSFSANTLTADMTNDTSAFQTNDASFDNMLRDNNKTGDNDMSRNTGAVTSDPFTLTGHASSVSDVQNSANLNWFNGSSMPSVQWTWDLGSMWHFGM